MASINPAATQALKLENQFLDGARANIDGVKGRQLRGQIWDTATDDDGDELRAKMASRRMYDRDLLKKLPHNRRLVVRGFDRRLVFWKKPTGVAIASVFTRMDEMLDQGAATPPMTLNELSAHLKAIAPNPKVPHLVGVCSTSGFTDDARNARHDYPNITLVLVEPRTGGGWRITAPEDVPGFVHRLFDPEDSEQKLARVHREIEKRSTDLLTGGLSAAGVAQDLDLPVAVVENAFREVARKEPELRVSGSAGERFLYRGAPVARKEKSSMGFVDRIKELFSSEGDEVAKINLLSERRAALASRRERLYDDVGKLEQREADLLTQGRENKSAVVRKRLAAQVAQVRKDISRMNATANMLNQQINIISTDIHNLTLIQQGQMASLPSTEELTENAVKAEEMLETLQADSELVTSLEAGVGQLVTTSEERDILAEFDAVPGSESAEKSSAGKARPIAQSAPDDFEADAVDFDAPRQGSTGKSRRKASDPEAT